MAASRAGSPSPLNRLFTPGERLGWVFRDRHALQRPFPEARPAAPLISAESLARLARAEVGLAQRVAKALAWGIAGSVLIGLGWVAYALQSEVDIRVAGAATALPLVAAAAVVWAQLRERRSAAEALEVHRTAVKDAYVDEVAAWQQRRAGFLAGERAAIEGLDEWGAVRMPPGGSRFDVFGGTLTGWEGLLTVFGTSVLAGRRPVTVVDLSREAVSAELAQLATGLGIAVTSYRLPADLPDCDLLAGLEAEQVVDVLVEAMHQGTVTDRVERSTDRLLLDALRQALRDEVSVGRLLAGLRVLMREPGDASALRPAERDRIAEELFSDDYRRAALPNLRRIQSLLSPLAQMGTRPGTTTASQLLRLAVDPGTRTAGSELVHDLLVQWLVHRVTRGGQPPGSTLVVVGADELPPAHLERLCDACERRDVRVVNLFRHLREGSLRAIGGGTAGFMRLGNHEEAAAAADYIGREHRFAVSQLTRTLTGGSSHSEGDSWARDWTRTVQHAEQTGWSDASTRQRVYEYTVEPRGLQGLPDYALVLVEHSVRGPVLTGVECNPEIALLPRVSMDPLPGVGREPGAAVGREPAPPEVERASRRGRPGIEAGPPIPPGQAYRPVNSAVRRG
jgi:hypothetical protein